MPKDQSLKQYISRFRKSSLTYLCHFRKVSSTIPNLKNKSENIFNKFSMVCDIKDTYINQNNF